MQPLPKTQPKPESLEPLRGNLFAYCSFLGEPCTIQKLDAIQETRVQETRIQETARFRKPGFRKHAIQETARFRKLFSRDSGNRGSGNHKIQEPENTRFRKPCDSGN